MLDWALASQSAATLDWAFSPLTMNGTLQSLEAAGRDDGDVASGYIDNFALGRLELAAGTTVNLVDNFDNQGDGLAVCEALYVDTLVLNPGAVLDNSSSGCPVYYLNLINGGTIVSPAGNVLNVPTADADDDGDVDLADFAFFHTCLLTPGPQFCLDRFDADHDQDLDLIDFAHFQRLLTIP
ncbi:MAG: hypothetical protein GY778_24240 [bacterium]|nr:hypothetical protein [bacterium]